MSKPEIPRSLGRYQIVRELGKGAMGVVYEGVDPVIGRRVAIKTARRDVLESSGLADELMERFLREARAAGGISHPNVITIYDAGEEGGIAYMAMEYIDSGTLYERLYSGSRMTVEEGVEIGAAVCSALAAAHEKGVIHRDVKPANIMMLADNTVKVADFGIARITDSKLTQEGVMVGTPQYMSPEQFSGMKVDGRSDLFSAAVIIYEMLTGEHPFPAHGVSAIMHQIIKVDPVPPRELNFTVNDNLSAVVIKALSKNTGRRYQDGKKMAAALVEALKENADPAVLGLAAPAGGSADAATVIAGADKATVVSSVRPDGTAPDSMASAPGVELPTALRKMSRRAILVPAVAALSVIGGILLFVAGSRGSNTPGVAPPSPNEKAFTRATIFAWLPKSQAAYQDAIANGPSLKNCVENGTANILVMDDETNEELMRAAGSVETAKFKRPSRSVTVTVSWDGYKPHSESFKPTKPNDVCEQQITLEPL
ncbi:MAG: serine/threonine-protein kinase [Candidatus Hydrogenedentes bacterium]|nr:serine/threonine-protein kinase [Candidatus Hydrogenedentota bacterium]